MHRFYCPQLKGIQAPDGRADAPVVTLDRQQSHHARKVLRMGVGDLVELLDGEGGVARAKVVAADRELTLRIEAVSRTGPVQPHLALAVATPKGSRAVDMVAALSQLGVSQLLPLTTTRSVVDPGDGKLERFELAAIESAKQCLRTHVMTIGSRTTLTELIAREPADNELRLIASVGGRMTPPALFDRLAAAKRLLVLVGPEGGWTDEELAAADAHGFMRWSLGPHVMRIETAACSAAAILRWATA